MTQEVVQRIQVNGGELEARYRGSGEPVVFIHGGMGDECAAIVTESALVGKYRVIDYHRRGWGNSSPAEGPVSIPQQAADCRTLIENLRVQRAHFVGQSFGGSILLQLALDAPEVVHSVALLEPALPSVLFNSPAFGAVGEKAGTMYGSGDKQGAVEAFAEEVGGADFRAAFDRTLPSGHFERWVAAADTLFQSEMPALQGWSFTGEDAARITQPVLNLRGVDTRPYFREVYETVRTWLPQAENIELPHANHCMLQTNPKGASELLAGFFSSHPLPG